MIPTSSFFRTVVSGLIIVVLLGGGASPVEAQERPDRGKTRTNVSPELLVSFQKSTPLNQFIELLNPIFKREQGKPVVDPKNRSMPIGIPISGTYYLDAFEQALEANGLTYKETETAFLVQKPTQTQEQKQAPADTAGKPPATLSTREIRINAILFSLNLTKVRNRGLRWNAILGSTQGGGQGGGGQGGGGQGGGGGGGQGGQGGQQQGRFSIRTDNLFESVDNILNTPDVVSLSRFRRFLNLVEQDNLGRTIANPQVTVQSGEQGRIQIGQDIPIQTTDFAGNTITKFVSTGIIIDVTPTLISQPVADTAGAPVVDFVHLDVRVEDSNSQPSAAGTVISRNQVDTEILLIDGEATAIGGLIRTTKSTSRSGIPILKDLPGWFFGLRYIFGNETTNVTKRELLIVLRAEVVDPLRARAREKYDKELLDQRRRNARETLRRLGKRPGENLKFPKPQTEQDSLK
ncbi:MAG: type II and III secretion system protein [Salinibacter sp.]